MGFFINSGALKEGEIILSDGRHHLYQVIEGKLTEYKKIITPPGDSKLWIPNQKLGVKVYDLPKSVVYIYNIDVNIWDVLDLIKVKKGEVDSYTLNIMRNFYDTIDKFV